MISFAIEGLWFGKWLPNCLSHSFSLTHTATFFDQTKANVHLSICLAAKYKPIWRSMCVVLWQIVWMKIFVKKKKSFSFKNSFLLRKNLFVCNVLSLIDAFIEVTRKADLCAQGRNSNALTMRTNCPLQDCLYESSHAHIRTLCDLGFCRTCCFGKSFDFRSFREMHSKFCCFSLFHRYARKEANENHIIYNTLYCYYVAAKCRLKIIIPCTDMLGWFAVIYILLNTPPTYFYALLLHFPFSLPHALYSIYTSIHMNITSIGISYELNSKTTTAKKLE
jgi:hypothetical protein